MTAVLQLHPEPYPRKVLMPPPIKDSYSDDDVEAEVARRISARDRALRDAGIDEQLGKLNAELVALRNSRSSQVTKDDLRDGLDAMRQWISETFMRKADGFDAEQSKALRRMVSEKQHSEKQHEANRKWHETIWGRVGIGVAVVVALIQLTGLIVTITHHGP